MSSQLPIQISEWQFENIGFDMPKDKAMAINAFIEEIFSEHLYWWCQVATQTKGRYKGYDNAILQFAQKHNITIDEDISFDGLKKKEFRQRKLIEQKTRKTEQPIVKPDTVTDANKLKKRLIHLRHYINKTQNGLVENKKTATAKLKAYNQEKATIEKILFE
jgi:hypothetical protein